MYERVTKNNSDELSEAISMAKNNEGDSHVDYTDQKTFINMKSEDLRAIAGFLSDMQSTIKYTSKVSDRKISLADSAKKIAKTIASQHNAS